MTMSTCLFEGPPCGYSVKLPVRHVRAVLRQRGDDVPERGQRLVDARRLPQPLRRRARLSLPLAARQVHQVQLADPETNVPTSHDCLLPDTEGLVYHCSNLLTFVL